MFRKSKLLRPASVPLGLLIAMPAYNTFNRPITPGAPLITFALREGSFRYLRYREIHPTDPVQPCADSGFGLATARVRATGRRKRRGNGRPLRVHGPYRRERVRQSHQRKGKALHGDRCAATPRRSEGVVATYQGRRQQGVPVGNGARRCAGARLPAVQGGAGAAAADGPAAGCAPRNLTGGSIGTCYFRSSRTNRT